MKKKICFLIGFMLISMSVLISAVNANPNIWLEIEGSFEGQAYVEMEWTVTAHDGTPPYRWSGSYGDGPYAWAGTPTYEVTIVLTHTYTEEGQYLWVVSCRDDDYDLAREERIVTIGPPPLIVEIIPPLVNEFWVNDNYQWDCNVIGAVGDVTYTWDFDDGSDPYYIKNPIHAFLEPTFSPDVTTVSVEVYDTETHETAYDTYVISPYSIPAGVYGYDLGVYVTKSGPFPNHVLRGWPITFTIETVWFASKSNVPQSEDWDVYWIWEKEIDGKLITHYDGNYWGPILPLPNQDWYQKRITRAAPSQVGIYCPFTVTLTSYPDHDYDKSNNEKILQLWTY